MSFTFLEPGPLVDGELELVRPHESLIEAHLASCLHPLTQRDMPQQARTTVETLCQFLSHSGAGHQPADPVHGLAPAYHFWMKVGHPDVPISIAGSISLRIGWSLELERYSGHIGYHVYPPARGRRLALRAAQLLLPLARRHGMTFLWITTNPDNAASRKTCERLGARLIDIVQVPPSHCFYQRGERAKCRYLLDVPP